MPPVNSLTLKEVSGANIHLVHGNISWTNRTTAILGQSRGHIVAIDATTLHYDIASFRGHSGAALLIRGKDLIGLHCEAYNDLDPALSESSPSTHADAVRLDLQRVHDAVQQAMR